MNSVDNSTITSDALLSRLFSRCPIEGSDSVRIRTTNGLDTGFSTTTGFSLADFSLADFSLADFSLAGFSLPDFSTAALSPPAAAAPVAAAPAAPVAWAPPAAAAEL